MKTDLPAYHVWRGLKSRCNNPKDQAYKNYGGRGVTVCDEWQNNVIAFSNWSLANGYQKGLTLDRIDTNGKYSPDNCRYVSMKDQQRNKRSNINISEDMWSDAIEFYKNTKARMVDVAKLLGVATSTFSEVYNGNYTVKNNIVYREAR